MILLLALIGPAIGFPTAADAQGADIDESDVAFITYEVEIALTDVEDFWDGDEHKTYRYGGVRVPPEARYFPDQFAAYIQKFPLANHPWSPGWLDGNPLWGRREAVWVPPRASGESDNWDLVTTCLDSEVFAAVNFGWEVGRREVAGNDWPDEYRAWQEPQLRDTSHSGWGDGRSTLQLEVALVETDSFGGHGGDCRRARCSGYVSRHSPVCDGVDPASGFEEKTTTSSVNVHFPTIRPERGRWVTGQLTTHKVTVELSGLAKAEVTVRAKVVRMRRGVSHAGVSLLETAQVSPEGSEPESGESEGCTPTATTLCGLAIEDPNPDELREIDATCVLTAECDDDECPFIDERYCHAFDEYVENCPVESPADCSDDSPVGDCGMDDEGPCLSEGAASDRPAGTPGEGAEELLLLRPWLADSVWPQPWFPPPLR